ncbi:MAG: hypothetical protein QOE62_2142 [Actinomycetota bacterium]|jgi:hypothetical protein|nr:hypothetical protein [Actinomycetota bacterium]
MAWGARGSRRATVTALESLTAAAAQLPDPPETAPTISIVLFVGEPDGHSVPAAFTLPRVVEVIAVQHGSGGTAPAAATTIVRVRPGESLAGTAARAASAARGDRVCFWRASNEPLSADVPGRLAQALDAAPDAAAATAQLVHPIRSRSRATPHDGRVRQFGVHLGVDHGVPVLVSGSAGEIPRLSSEPVVVSGASAACLLVDRIAYAEAGGLPDSPDLDVSAFELCRRLRALGRSVIAVPDAVVLDHRPVPTESSLTHPVASTAPGWIQLLDETGAALMREAEPRADARLRIAITVAAPNRKVASRWGDWHLAEAFAGALRERGHDARVQTADAADDPAGRACDVRCVLRGLAPVRRTRGQRHVLWIISHPEQIEIAELDAADLVLVASDRFAAELRTRTHTPVESFLQATDPARFCPQPLDPEHRHDVTVVAKSRDQYRTAVADAIESGLRPSIYGSGWDRLVDPSLVVTDYVENAELARVYSSAGVLLNDHWTSMRDWGFVSNRIFDALACGAPVISDDLPEISDLFGDAVPTFTDSDELRRLVDEALADPEAARARARRGMDIVIAHHTFGHRAAEFLDALARHGLDRAP